MSDYVNVTELFGCDVFNDSVMEERLPKKVYKELKKTIEEGKELSPEVADVVAHEMKEWAIEKGATHYSHWFQPLTGVTAEKHDAFIFFHTISVIINRLTLQPKGEGCLTTHQSHCNRLVFCKPIELHRYKA